MEEEKVTLSYEDILVPKCLLRYTVEAQKVFTELILAVQLSATNIIGIKKKKKRKLEADIKARREYL